MGTIIFDPVTLTLEFDPVFENFNLANNFWTVSARALMFHMSIPCYKYFLWVALFFTLWPWLWGLTHFLKTLTLLITFEHWVWELWYLTWIFYETRPSRENNFELVNLTLEFDLLNHANNFSIASARALIFHMNIPCDKTFPREPLFFTLWPWPWSLTHFLKT